MAVLRLITGAVGGLADGLAAAERAVSAASQLGREPAPAPPARPDPVAVARLQAAYPSQRASAELLEPYVEHAAGRARA